MRHFRHIIAMAVAAVCFCGTHAGEVTSEMAMAAANAWMAANPSFGTTGSAVSAASEKDGDTLLWWTVMTSNGGAIFVAPDTSIEPVLAAVSKCSGELPEGHPLRAILSADVAKRLAANAAATVVTPPTPKSPRLTTSVSPSYSLANITNAEIAAAVAAAENRWARFTAGSPRPKLGASSVPENVTVKAVVPGFGDDENGYLRFWNQSGYAGFADLRSNASFEPCFNLYTPENAVCGCVATAGAALLQYFGAHGLSVNVTRTCKYNDDSVQLTTISATNRYDWSLLPEEIGGGEPNTMLELQLAAEAEEGGEGGGDATKKFNDVAALLGRAAYDMGVCVKMDYSDDESGALLKDLATAFTEDFGFMTARYVLIGTNNVFDTIFEDLCRTNPVVLGIRNTKTRAGHAILGVGYGEDNENTPYTRLFMGWGGKGDAWYNLPTIQSYDLVDDAIVSIMYAPPVGHATIAAAKAAALENHKPILIISGTPGGVATDNLLNYIKDNNYETDFEVYFANYAADPYADQDPSFGIFNPLVFNNNTDNRWAFYNGRLAYCADTNEASVVQAIADGLDAWTVAYEKYLSLQDASTNGIVVATYDYYDEVLDGELFDSVFAPGQTVSLYSPSVQKEPTIPGFIWKCSRWVVSSLGDEGYDVVASGTGTNATFTVEANTAYELCWIWEPESVLLKVWAKTNANNPGVVDPDAKDGIWWPYGETMTAIAMPPNLNSRNSQFSHWSGDTNGCNMVGSAIEILADYPRVIAANFKGQGGVTGSTAKYNLSIVSDPAEITAPCTYGVTELSYDHATSILNGPIAISVPATWEDATGGVWRCTGWTAGSGMPSGDTSVAGFDLKVDTTITWFWEVVPEPGPEPGPGPEPPIIDPAEIPIGPVVGGITNSALVIYATNTTQMAVETRVSNAVAGYWYSIWSADEVDGPYSYVTGAYVGDAKRKVEKPVPEILSLVIVFDPADSAKFYRVVVTEEEPE